MKNDSGIAIPKPIDGVLKLVFVLMIVCLSWQVQAACTFFDGFKDNNDGTVTDPRNGLIWKRCAEGFDWDGSACRGSVKEVNWFEAMQTAKQSRFLGKADWRIPSKAEFEAVLGKRDDCKNNVKKLGQFAASRSIAHAVKTDGHPGLFWSASPYAGGVVYAWYVDFDDGDVSNGNIRNGYHASHVRLVRANQSLGGKAALEFNTEYAKIDQYKKEIAAKKAKEEKEEKEEQAADARQAKEQAREDERRAREEQNRAQTSKGLTSVWVEAICVTGGYCICSDLRLTGGPGELSSSTCSGYLNGSGRSVAGSYEFSVSFKQSDGVQICSGRIGVSGARENLRIKLYPDCSDAGTYSN